MGPVVEGAEVFLDEVFESDDADDAAVVPDLGHVGGFVVEVVEGPVEGFVDVDIVEGANLAAVDDGVGRVGFAGVKPVEDVFDVDISLEGAGGGFDGEAGETGFSDGLFDVGEQGAAGTEGEGADLGEGDHDFGEGAAAAERLAESGVLFRIEEALGAGFGNHGFELVLIDGGIKLVALFNADEFEGVAGDGVYHADEGTREPCPKQ